MQLIEITTAEIIPAMTVKARNKKEPYKKSLAVRDLERLANAEAVRLHPLQPHLCPRIFRDDTSNNLTKCVCEYIRLMGGFVSRINNQGTFNRITGRYIPSTSRKGLADVMAVYQGRSLSLEIKKGKDKQSEAQKKVQADVIKSGGFYFVVKDFEEFKTWFDFLFI